MLAVTGMRARSMLGGFSNPTTPSTPCHHDADCEARLGYGKTSSWRVPAPVAVEDAADDAVVFIEAVYPASQDEG
jgi:hypothetical protein